MSEKMEKCVIQPLQEKDFDGFVKIFSDYFVDEMKFADDKEKFCNFAKEFIVNQQYAEKIILIDLAKFGEEIAGFIIYQIDSERSDWCERPGVGFIREFYVAPAHRRKNLGSLLIKRADEMLKKMGANDVYLASAKDEGVITFYEKNGYRKTGQQNEDGQEIMEKELD